MPASSGASLHWGEDVVDGDLQADKPPVADAALVSLLVMQDGV